MNKLEIKGTPVCTIYEDRPKENIGIITVFIPNTGMNIKRRVEGSDLRLRANAAGVAIAKIVSNFIENSPILGNEIGISVAQADGSISYPESFALRAKDIPVVDETPGDELPPDSDPENPQSDDIPPETHEQPDIPQSTGPGEPSDDPENPDGSSTPPDDFEPPNQNLTE